MRNPIWLVSFWSALSADLDKSFGQHERTEMVGRERHVPALSALRGAHWEKAGVVEQAPGGLCARDCFALLVSASIRLRLSRGAPAHRDGRRRGGAWSGIAHLLCR